MSGRGREDLLDVREWSGSPPGSPGVVGRTSRMSKSGREALQDVREWSDGPTGCPEVIKVAFPDVREWSGGLPGCPGVVGSPSRMSGNGPDTLTDVPPGCT